MEQTLQLVRGGWPPPTVLRSWVWCPVLGHRLDPYHRTPGSSGTVRCPVQGGTMDLQPGAWKWCNACPSRLVPGAYQACVVTKLSAVGPVHTLPLLNISWLVAFPEMMFKDAKIRQHETNREHGWFRKFFRYLMYRWSVNQRRTLVSLSWHVGFMKMLNQDHFLSW